MRIECPSNCENKYLRDDGNRDESPNASACLCHRQLPSVIRTLCRPHDTMLSRGGSVPPRCVTRPDTARSLAKKRSAPGVPIGYARVSTDDQNLALQLDALKKSGCDRVFTDKVSGTRLVRPGLDDALSHLRAGDTLVVWKLDRLGRSVKGLVDLVNPLEAVSGKLIHG